MCGRISAGLALIAPGGQHLPVGGENDGTDGHIIGGQRGPGLIQCQPHPLLVFLHHSVTHFTLRSATGVRELG